MNIPNNKRRQDSRRRIETALVRLLQDRELEKITVKEICTAAEVNRTTFYANYLDVYDLADKLREKLEADFSAQFAANAQHAYTGTDGALRMFTHIYENQLFYKTYFKLGYDEAHQVMIYDASRAESDFHGEHIDYHIEFFRAGLNAIIKKWMAMGCKESPEEMAAIIKAEYQGR